MSDTEFNAKCAHCETVFSKAELIEQLQYSTMKWKRRKYPPNRFIIKCSSCEKDFEIDAPDEQVDDFERAFKAIEQKRMMDFADKIEKTKNQTPPSQNVPSMATSQKSIVEVLQVQNRNEKPSPPPEQQIDKIEYFQNKIKNIDKNLEEFERTRLIRNALEFMIDEPNSDIEASFEIIKKEFGFTERKIEAFRKDLNDLKKRKVDEKKDKKYKEIENILGAPPKELTTQEKQEALEYLRHPNLINNISRDLMMAGEIVGEEINKMMLYFSAISRKFNKPISLVIFGKSSSGKSYLANAVEKFIPPEDKLILSSSTARAFEYIGDKLKHKFVLIQEWEGIENILPTIRVLQSEGRLSRLSTMKNQEDDSHYSATYTQECPCAVVYTTTREDIHDENSTRIFELYADETVEQTENVVQRNILKSNLMNRQDESEKKRIINLHQNAQRLLEPIDVSIPYVHWRKKKRTKKGPNSPTPPG